MYRSTQRGTLIITVVLAALAVVVLARIVSGWNPILLGVGALLVVILYVFRSLTIEVDSTELRCYFGHGFFTRRFPLDDIASAKPELSRWYHGWGIRLTLAGWMYSAAGFHIVELTFRSGRRFRIGTDDPQRVVDEIHRLKDETS